MRLALLRLWSEPVGLRKLDNLLSYWLDQELRRQDWHPPGSLSNGGCQGLFFGYCCWMILICNLCFCLKSPFLFQNCGLHRERSPWMQWLDRRGPHFPVHKHKKPGLGHSLVWPCSANSSLSGWFCLLYLWEGRQTAWSPANAAATIGLAASLMNVPWINYKGIISTPRS